jgi:YHS domain-containing protein
VVRAILYLLASVLLITVVRAIVGVVVKGFGDLLRPESSAPSRTSPGQPGEAAHPQSLKKDPVCGTFVVSATQFQKTVKGSAYFFCSAECRDKFQG